MRAAIHMVLLVVGAFAFVNDVSAASERLLFNNSHYDVTIPADYHCGEPVPVTVRSSRPELFKEGSPELQRIADATQAVLRFECPDVPALKIEGWLAGLGDPVYLGRAEDRSNWKLTTRQSIQAGRFEKHRKPGREGDRFGSTGEGSGFTVANLYAGMSVDEARTAVMQTFGVAPHYDPETGVMTMQADGCPADYDWTDMSPRPERGWKCLRARFTDQRRARLYLLDLVQVVDADTRVVERRLIQKFGEPVYRGSQRHEGRWWQNHRIRAMAWGEVVDTVETAANDGQRDVYNLQAKVMPRDGVTVVTVTLYEPKLRRQRPSRPDHGIPKLTL